MQLTDVTLHDIWEVETVPVQPSLDLPTCIQSQQGGGILGLLLKKSSKYIFIKSQHILTTVYRGYRRVISKGGSGTTRGNSFFGCCARLYFYTCTKSYRTDCKASSTEKVMTHTRRMSRDRAVLNESSSYASGGTHTRKQTCGQTQTCEHTHKLLSCLGFSSLHLALPPFPSSSSSFSPT